MISRKSEKSKLNVIFKKIKVLVVWVPFLKDSLEKEIVRGPFNGKDRNIVTFLQM